MIVLISGNFGRKQGSGNKIETVSTQIKRNGLFHYLQYAGEHNWKVYKKHHWLKPFAWLYQIGRYTRQVVTNPGVVKSFRKGTAVGKKRFDLLERLGTVNNDGASDGG